MNGSKVIWVCQVGPYCIVSANLHNALKHGDLELLRCISGKEGSSTKTFGNHRQASVTALN